MFENLSDKLQDVFRKISGKGRITEENISEAIREVRRALLEADVNLKVVKEFITNVKEKSVGQDVIKSISPGQQFIKIINDEMIELMGKENQTLAIGDRSPTVYMMVGLQGSGKTTTSAKLALNLRKKGKRPLLVAADIYRPAAIKHSTELTGPMHDCRSYCADATSGSLSLCNLARPRKHGLTSLTSWFQADTVNVMSEFEQVTSVLLCRCTGKAS